MFDNFDGVIARWFAGRAVRPRSHCARNRRARPGLGLGFESLEPRWLLSQSSLLVADPGVTVVVQATETSGATVSESAMESGGVSTNGTIVPSANGSSQNAGAPTSAVDLQDASILSERDGTATDTITGPALTVLAVPVNSETVGVALDLTSSSVYTPVAATITVLAPSGQPVAATTAKQGMADWSLSLLVTTNASDPSMLYVEIDPHAGLASGVYDDTLQVTEVYSNDVTPLGVTFSAAIPNGTASNAAWTATSAGSTTVPPPSGTVSGPMPDRGGGAPASPPPAFGAAGVPINDRMTTDSDDSTSTSAAVGPLPARSAAPIAGVLEQGGDPIPVVTPVEAVRVSLARIAPVPEAFAVVVQARDVHQLESVPPGTSVRLEILRGNGGLPLLATSLIGDLVVRGAVTPQVRDAGDTEAQGGFVSSAPENSTPARPASPEPVTVTRPESTPRRGGLRRSSAVAGLTAAVALVLGVLVPDLVTAFQFPPKPRLRIRLARLRRVLGGRTPRIEC
jgi:hypothetical protein